jgi:hypothetical protein
VFTFTLAGGSTNPLIGFGDGSLIVGCAFEITPASYDVSSNFTGDETSSSFSGPTLNGTGTTDFYIIASGGQFFSSTYTIPGWTIVAGSNSSGYNGNDLVAYLISSGTQSTTYTKVNAPAFPYYALAGAAFLDNTIVVTAKQPVETISIVFRR